MQESDDVKQTNLTDNGALPTVADAWHRGGLAHKRINVIETELDHIKRAFVKDDLGTTDYEGHRKAHNELVADAKLIKEYKVGMTKDFLKVISATALGAFLTGLFAYLKDHLK